MHGIPPRPFERKFYPATKPIGQRSEFDRQVHPGRVRRAGEFVGNLATRMLFGPFAPAAKAVGRKIMASDRALYERAGATVTSERQLNKDAVTKPAVPVQKLMKKTGITSGDPTEGFIHWRRGEDHGSGVGIQPSKPGIVGPGPTRNPVILGDSAMHVLQAARMPKP